MVVAKEAVKLAGPPAALVLTILQNWSTWVRRKYKRDIFFRSVQQLVSEAPGMQASAVETAIAKLADLELLMRNPSGYKAPHRTTTFRLTESGRQLAMSKPILKIGREDAEMFGPPAALLLAHLEQREAIGKDFVSVAKAAEYLELGKKTVERALRKLFVDGVITEIPYKQQRGCRGFTLNDEHKRKRLRPNRTAAAPDQSNFEYPEVTSSPFEPTLVSEVVSATDITEAGAMIPAVPVSVTPDHSEPSRSTSTEIFNPYASLSRGAGDPSPADLESLDRRGKEIIATLQPEQLRTILQGSTVEVCDLVTALLSSVDHADVRLAAFLPETLVVAFLIRRNPAISTSNTVIRQAAYDLTLNLQTRLEESVPQREEVLKGLTRGLYAETTLPPDEKVRLIQQAVSMLNAVGIPENPPQGCKSAPNPVILWDQVDLGEGTTFALNFFRRTPDCSVARLVKIIRRESQPKPDKLTGKPTHSRLHLHAIFTNFRKLDTAF